MLSKFQITIIYFSYSLLIFVIPINYFLKIGIIFYLISVIFLFFQCRKQTGKLDYIGFIFICALTVFLGVYILENTMFALFNFAFYSIAAILCTFFYHPMQKSPTVKSEPLSVLDYSNKDTELLYTDETNEITDSRDSIQEWEDRLKELELDLSKKFEDKILNLSESMNDVYHNQNFVIQILQNEREELVNFKTRLEKKNEQLEHSQIAINKNFNQASKQLQKEIAKRITAESTNLDLVKEKERIITRDKVNSERIIHLQEILEKYKKGEEKYEQIHKELRDARSKKDMYSQKIKDKDKEIYYQTEMISEALTESELLEVKLKDIEKEKELINTKYENLLSENDTLKKRIERQNRSEEISRKNLLKQWKIEYPNFEFHPSVIKEFLQFKDVESRALFLHELGELHYAESPHERNRSKLKSKDGVVLHLGFTTKDNQVYRINYEVRTNPEYKIVLTDIYKKGSKKYKQ